MDDTLDPVERDRLLKLFNQRVHEVKATEAPNATRFQTSPEEAYRLASFRSACERLYLGFARAYGPLFVRLRLLSSWKDPWRSFSWSVTYGVLWWYDLLGLVACVSLAVALVRPEVFRAPIFGCLRATVPKQLALDHARIDEEADAIGEVINLGPPVVEAAAAPATADPEVPVPLKRKVAKALAPIQVSLGSIADRHEQAYNLALHRSPERTRQDVAVILAVSGLVLYLTPVWLLVKGAMLSLGLSIFVIPPLMKRFPQIGHFLAAHLQLLRQVPTNAQLTYAALLADPSLCDRIEAVRVAPKAPGEQVVALGKRQRLAGLIKKGLDLTERGSEYLSGQRDFNLAEQILQLTGLPAYVGPAKADEPASFFASHNGVPGHLVVPLPSSPPGILRFRTGIAIGSRPRTERFAWPMADIKAIRKVGGLNLAGLGMSHLGIGLDDMAVGLEVVDSEGVAHRFDRCFRRDAAFARLLVAVSSDGIWEVV